MPAANTMATPAINPVRTSVHGRRGGTPRAARRPWFTKRTHSRTDPNSAASWARLARAKKAGLSRTAPPDRETLAGETAANTTPTTAVTPRAIRATGSASIGFHVAGGGTAWSTGDPVSGRGGTRWLIRAVIGTAR